MKSLAWLVFFFCAYRVSAAVGEIQPANPTSADRIFIDVSIPYSELQLQPVVITGFQIEITFRGYVTVPAGGGQVVALGPLPAGVYSILVRYVVEDGNGNVVQTITDPAVTLAVRNAVFVPALDLNGFALLIFSVVVAGLFVLRR